MQLLAVVDNHSVLIAPARPNHPWADTATRQQSLRKTFQLRTACQTYKKLQTINRKHFTAIAQLRIAARAGEPAPPARVGPAKVAAAVRLAGYGGSWSAIRAPATPQLARPAVPGAGPWWLGGCHPPVGAPTPASVEAGCGADVDWGRWKPLSRRAASAPQTRAAVPNRPPGGAIRSPPRTPCRRPPHPPPAGRRC